MPHDFDLLIAGGGLAGNCLALALRDSDLNIGIIEAQSKQQLATSPAGDRALALAAGTVNMLKSMGIWQDIADKATPIKDIHISDKGHFGKTRLSAHQQNVPALGYVISARDIETHVANRVAETSAKDLSPARVAGIMAGPDSINVHLKSDQLPDNLSARLLVGADGGNSTVRNLLDIALSNTEYRQTALVTSVTCSRPHHNTAYERFTESGPLALLPIGSHQMSVVWTRTHDDAETMQLENDALFISQLQDCFGYMLGELTLSAPRRAFPLQLIRAQKMTDKRVVLIGNAIHQLHPVAGQGFNLGLRDVVALAEKILDQPQDIGQDDLLADYASLRRQDHDNTIRFTDNLVKIFSNNWMPMALARNTGLATLDHLPVAKSWLTRHAMGLAERQPRIGTKR